MRLKTEQEKEEAEVEEEVYPIRPVWSSCRLS